MGFPAKIMTLDCFQFFTVFFTLVSGIFAKSKCERNIHKFFPENLKPAQYFVHAFEKLNYASFKNAEEINHHAQGYFEALLRGIQLKNDDAQILTQDYCHTTYEDGNPCIITIFLYLKCNGDTRVIDAIKKLYENIIYDDISNIYLDRYNTPTIPSCVLQHEVFAKSECEKNILKVFPEKTVPKKCFLHAFENFSIKYFEEIIEMNNDAQGYFEDLLQRKHINVEQFHMTPKQFCESNYNDENAKACIRVIDNYFKCPEDTLAITAVTLLYNTIIYEHIPNYYGTGYGENPIPSDYDHEITKKRIGMLQKYFKYIQGIANSTTDDYFQTIQQYCDPQYFRDINTKNEDYVVKFNNKTIGMAKLTNK